MPVTSRWNMICIKEGKLLDKQGNIKPHQTTLLKSACTNNKTKQEKDYFIAGQSQKPTEVSAKSTLKICKEYSILFTESGCFKGTLSLQVNNGVKPYQVSSMCKAYALQEPFKKELESLQNN